jgi:hypothetical protein
MLLRQHSSQMRVEFEYREEERIKSQPVVSGGVK